MPEKAPRLTAILDALEARHGRQEGPRTRDAFELVLWENVAYLVDDRRRADAFAALKAEVGTRPEEILAAPVAALRAVAARGGILADQRVGKLLRCAEVAQKRFAGDVSAALPAPFPQARKALTQFPSLAEPGAEKVLLFSGAHPVLALDSNALRVLLRLGFGREAKAYAASYRSAQEAARSHLKADVATMRRAHLLLRRHGQELCRRTKPRCPDCPVAARCAFYRRGSSGR
jgi:endonuclease-3